MPITLRVRYSKPADLAGQLEEHKTRGALLLPIREALPQLAQFSRIALHLTLPGESAEVAAEVLQVLSGVGLVVRLDDPDLAMALIEDSLSTQQGSPPLVSLVDEAPAAPDQPEHAAPAVEDDTEERAAQRGQGPLSWSIEKLQAEWGTLGQADRVRVAKYGKRGARALVLRLTDSTLLNVLLSNPQITPEEVAAMAGTASMDPAILRRILGNAEWLRHTAVARNLVCHPKATLPQITKAADHLSDNEIRQLTRTGKVRAAVKRLLMKKLEQRSLHGR